MKTQLTLLITLSILSTSALAQTCRGSNCAIAGGSAAGAMVTGYAAVRGLIKVKDLENKFTQVLFNGRGNANSHITSVQDGDRVLVQHNLSAEANRQYHIDTLESNIDSAHSNAATYRSQAMMALVPKPETYTDHEGKTQTRMSSPDYGSHLMYNNMADSAEQEARQIERQLSEVRAGRGTVPVYKFDKMMRRTDARQVGAWLAELSRSGSKVIYMNRLPAAIATKVARGARNGWMLAATAVALGLVTVEELTSGAIARRLDGETPRTRNPNW